MKFSVEIDAADIPSMRQMSDSEYRRYVEQELLLVDHHDVLRSAVAQYPLAVTREQMKILISVLQGLTARVGADSP